MVNTKILLKKLANANNMTIDNYYKVNSKGFHNEQWTENVLYLTHA